MVTHYLTAVGKTIALVFSGASKNFQHNGSVLRAANSMQLIPGLGNFTINFSDFYQKALNIAIAVAIVVAISMVSVSGYSMMMAQGDGTKIKNAKEQIQDVIMGLVLILLAATVVRLVFQAFQINVVEVK